MAPYIRLLISDSTIPRVNESHAWVTKPNIFPLLRSSKAIPLPRRSGGWHHSAAAPGTTSVSFLGFPPFSIHSLYVFIVTVWECHV